MLAGQKALVTGAGGFIGSHLTEALVKAGANVTAMIRYSSTSSWGNLEFCDPEVKRNLEVVAGNVEDFDFVFHAAKGKSIIFHLAALIAIPYSYVAPRSYVRTNVEGTLNVLEAARRLEVGRVVHTSTSEVYGTAVRVPIDEDHPLQGQSPYSASKIGADKIAGGILLLVPDAGRDRPPVQYLRAPAVGARLHSDHHCAGFGARRGRTRRARAAARHDLRRGHRGGISRGRDRIRRRRRDDQSGYRHDAQHRRIRRADHAAHGAWQNRSGRIHGASGRQKAKCSSWSADNTKAKRLLGWEAKTPLDDGLARSDRFCRPAPGPL